ncbi:META domain-containing protein [Hufsiella arboris]|nr:META domain-containing protein [Hufsiella arboris]
MKSTSEEPQLEGTHWKLVALNEKSIDLGENAFVEFKDKKASGKAGCNSFTSEYESAGKSLSLSKIASTKMFCNDMMDKENQIITNLESVKRYEIRYGLLYLYGSNKLLMTYKK